MPVKNELSKYSHEHYKRWIGMIQRCRNPNSTSFKERRAKGIDIVPEWAPENPQGLYNYAKWITAELVKFPEMVGTDFRVLRLDVTKDYGPDNCQLATHTEITRKRISTILNVNVVVEMRRYKKQNPSATLADMEALFHFSQANISRSLRGISWSNADVIEAPLPKQEPFRKKFRTNAREEFKNNSVV